MTGVEPPRRAKWTSRINRSLDTFHECATIRDTNITVGDVLQRANKCGADRPGEVYALWREDLEFQDVMAVFFYLKWITKNCYKGNAFEFFAEGNDEDHNQASR